MPDGNLDNLVVLILAGGTGTRLEPLSTVAKPKQFLKFFGERSLLQDTYNRIENLIPGDRILFLTQHVYVEMIEEQIPHILENQVLAEPLKQDTAAAVAFSSFYCQQRFGNPLMLFLPSDHWIQTKVEFQNSIKFAVEILQNSRSIGTFGIQPEAPSTQYGYLRRGEKRGQKGNLLHFQLLGFTEKPNEGRAKKFLESGDYFWNSGIFLWHTETILGQIKKHLPKHYQSFSLLSHRDFVDLKKSRKAFESVPKISIDYGVLEKAKELEMIQANFSWSDLGSWQAIEALLQEGKVQEKDLDPTVKDFLDQRKGGS